jgi:GT2 family glycosyltransferase
MKYKITASIVLFNNHKDMVKRAIESFLRISIPAKLYLIDNSPTDSLKCTAKDERVHYIKTKKNLGFGKGHNIALQEVVKESDYHLILNPDVSFDKGVIPELLNQLEADKTIGLIMPRVYYNDGTEQKLCKRLPKPSDLFVRRFSPKIISDFLFKGKISHYEMHDKNYSEPFLVPYLSGCFMLLRTSALKKIGYFDERFFMYMEDVDLSRRMISEYKNIYYPYVHIYHGFAKESYSNYNLLWAHIISAIKYFNKWGWFIDKSRNRINNSLS